MCHRHLAHPCRIQATLTSAICRTWHGECWCPSEGGLIDQCPAFPSVSSVLISLQCTLVSCSECLAKHLVRLHPTPDCHALCPHTGECTHKHLRSAPPFGTARLVVPWRLILSLCACGSGLAWGCRFSALDVACRLSQCQHAFVQKYEVRHGCKPIVASQSNTQSMVSIMCECIDSDLLDIPIGGQVIHPILILEVHASRPESGMQGLAEI